MDTNTLTRDDSTSTRPSRRVRTDLVAGIGLLAVVVAGKLLWQASDLGMLTAFGAH